MHELKATVAGNIKRLRQKQGLSASALAEHVGVSQSTISDWECGKKMPRADSIVKLSEFFGVNKADLLYDPCDTQDTRTHELLDLEMLLASKSRLVFRGRILSSEEKALALRLITAALGGIAIE